MAAISENDILYVIDILDELCALADPSEYFEEEVEQAKSILRNLKEYPFNEYLNSERLNYDYRNADEPRCD